MMKIAAVVLTKDEEINLPHCLRSLCWIDELIVCDSGSTDNTLQIARDFGANVFIHVPVGEFTFAEQRNWAIVNCIKNSDWVLFIDADEIVTEKLKTEIIEKIDNPNGRIGFRLCFKFMFMGRWIKHVTQFPTWHDRLLLRGKVAFTGGMLEYFNCSAEKIGYINEPYLHYGFNKGFADWVDKHNRYSSEIAKRLDSKRRGRIDWKGLVKIKDDDPRSRKRALENLAGRFPVAYPFSRFFYQYIVKKGFLDGYPGLIYSLMLFQYGMVVWFKTIELKRRRDNLPL